MTSFVSPVADSSRAEGRNRVAEFSHVYSHKAPGTASLKEVSEEAGMTNKNPGTTRIPKYFRPTVPVILALTGLTVIVAITFMVGWFWFGWQDIAQNRLILRSLPIPPGAERTNVSSYGDSEDDSILTPPGNWNTLAEYDFDDYDREYLAEFYISAISGEWQHCVRELVPGVWFVRDNVLVGVSTSNAPSVKGPGSFEIHVDQDYVRNPCDR